MKKQILVTAVLVGALATGAFAFGGNCDCNAQGMKNKQGMKNQQNMQQQTQKKGWHGYKMRQKRIQHSDNMMMGQRGGMLAALKLTEDQKFQISILRDEMKLEMKKLRGSKKQGKMMKFISDNGFNKKAFIKQSDENHSKRVAIKANHMEKVFKILTKEQVVELKKNLKT